ncbi:MAG: tetratricopeptide repeat protein [Bacteroidota bacterium]
MFGNIYNGRRVAMYRVSTYAICKNATLLVFILLTTLSVNAQLFGTGERTYLRDGNKAYVKGSYGVADSAYQEALTKNNASHAGHFNRGDALYKQEKYEDAVGEFQLAANMAEDPKEKAQAYYNLGNALLSNMQQQGNLEKSIEAFKQSLRLNPNDEATRYNLAYAQNMQKNGQGGDGNDQNQKDQDQQNKDQQNKDNQDQQNKDQQQDQQNQENQDQQSDPEKQKNQNQQAQQQQMSPEEIARMLEALMYQEEKLQKDLQKKKVKKGPRVKPEKDW